MASQSKMSLDDMPEEILLMIIDCVNGITPKGHKTCVMDYTKTLDDPNQCLENFCGFLKLALVNKRFHVLATDRKSTRLNSSHSGEARMPSSA